MAQTITTTTTRHQQAQEALVKIDRKLHAHQIDGTKWMMELEDAGSGGILADDPGLGKTYQALSLIVNSMGSTLVVVPTCILYQWRDIAEELLGKHAVYVHHGRRQPNFPMTRIVLTTYGVVRTEETLAEKNWERIILDEIHEIKSRRSKISKAVMRLGNVEGGPKCHLRWGMSGTPVQNTPEETANLFRFVLGYESSNRDKLDVVAMIRSHLLRRRKEVVLADKLPQLDLETVSVAFASESEKKYYEKIQKNVKKDFMKAQESCLTAQEENVVMFELLLRLRQVSQHPQLVLNGLWRKFHEDPNSMFHGQEKPPKWPHGPSSKHKCLLELLEEHPDEGTLVFCQFTEEMDMLEEFVVERGHRCLRLDGRLNNSERAEVLEQCRGDDGVPPVTLIQIKAGGVGLNLQAFSRVYILSPDWNPCNEIQAMARSHRLGQTRRVVVKRLVLESTKELSVIDDRIMGVQERKRDLMADLLEEESLRCNGRRRKMGLTTSDYKRLLKA